MRPKGYDATLIHPLLRELFRFPWWKPAARFKWVCAGCGLHSLREHDERCAFVPLEHEMAVAAAFVPAEYAARDPSWAVRRRMADERPAPRGPRSPAPPEPPAPKTRIVRRSNR